MSVGEKAFGPTTRAHQHCHAPEGCIAARSRLLRECTHSNVRRVWLGREMQSEGKGEKQQIKERTEDKNSHYGSVQLGHQRWRCSAAKPTPITIRRGEWMERDGIKGDNSKRERERNVSA